MSSIWNNRISISFFGEAEGAAIGVTIDGLPAGEFIDSDEIRRYMDRRTPDSYRDENTRRTPLPRIMSGVSGDRTSGGPLCAFIQNVDRRPREERKNELSANTRVGNADYTGAVHFRGYNDVMDRSSRAEKLTAPLCFAGAVCAQILERRGIFTGAHIAQIHNIKDNPYDRVKLDRDAVISVRYKDFPVINDRKGWLMLEDIARAKEAGESLGGIIECAAVNVPAGVGSPIFDGLENNIAQLIFGIPSVKGLEFGAGFSTAKMVGSQSSDDFYVDEHGHVLTRTNNHGGILGGISSGMPITLNVAFKPVQNEGSGGLGDTCIVPKVVPCVEAAVNIALLSNMLDYPSFC
ncbi:MAG: chorismate synthase [Ruminococcus sp.]|nr:chorismate synthase [Ruminococcus sp.]